MNEFALPLQFLGENLSLYNLLQLVLTAMLVGLYYVMYNSYEKQTQIQETQSEIMNRQTSLMAANHKPEVSVDGDKRAAGDKTKIPLSNGGNGPALDLHLTCSVYKQYQDNSGEIQFLPANRGTGTVVSPVPVKLTRAENQVYLDGKGNGPSHNLEEGETGIEFVSEIELSPATIGSNAYNASFSDVMKRISQEWDTSTIALQIDIVYRDLANQLYQKNIESYQDIPLSEDLDFQNAVSKGDSRDPIGSPIPENSHEPAVILDPDKMKT